MKRSLPSRALVIVPLLASGLVFTAVRPSLALLCRKPNGAVIVRPGCKGKVVPITAAELGEVGVGEKGEKGDKGDPGPAGDEEVAVRVEALEKLLASVSLGPDGSTIRFTGVNVQVVSGVGATDGPINGRGNL